MLVLFAAHQNNKIQFGSCFCVAAACDRKIAHNQSQNPTAYIYIKIVIYHNHIVCVCMFMYGTRTTTR